ncbi:hypothetical protein [uncultured Acinetobacter sp.]|uniref:hypothetical protein n=1 Tax=Acinetobacter soli TaxID=487316 RepID=UPI002585BE21|nr:hypothetical protein [uncultured Acinetobacter sp.]
MRNKLFFALGILTLSSISYADDQTLINLSLLDDIDTWADGGKSLFNWSDFNQLKERGVNTSILSPVQIYYEFKRNVFTAESKYTNNFQVVYGPFQGVEKNNAGEPLVVYDVNYGNHIYLNGLTPKEAQYLDVSVPIKLMCTNFKMDNFGDMSASCSQIINKKKFISSILVRQSNQILDADPKYKKIKSNIEQVSEKMEKGSLNFINENCKIIDSKNYDLCLDTFRKVFYKN